MTDAQIYLKTPGYDGRPVVGYLKDRRDAKRDSYFAGRVGTRMGDGKLVTHAEVDAAEKLIARPLHDLTLNGERVLMGVEYDGWGFIEVEPHARTGNHHCGGVVQASVYLVEPWRGEVVHAYVSRQDFGVLNGFLHVAIPA